MGWEPNNDRVLVKVDPLKDEVRGGVIVMANTSAQTIRTGTILSVGKGRVSKESGEHLPMELKVGDKIGFLRWHLEHKNGKQLTSTLSTLDEEVGILKEYDVLFVIEGEVRVG
jgi:co-chaperonin GroES (HSP10)